MPSNVDVANIALSDLGASSILSLTQENSTAAALCNRRLPFVRDATIRAFPWKCARHRAQLAQDTESPSWGWQYRYRLPAEPNYCLRVWRLQEEDDNGSPWKVEGRYLLTDSDTANIMYLRRLKDVNDWDALLIEAVAARLASSIAYKLTGSKTLAETMYKLYKDKLREARAADSQEGTPDDMTRNRLMLARRGG